MKRVKKGLLVFMLIAAGMIFQGSFLFSQDVYQEEQTKAQLRGGQSSLELYYTHYKCYPESISILISEGYMGEEGNIDAWGNEFYYEKLEGGNYSLGSAGPDKEFGTEDDIDSPINPARHTLKVSSLYTFANNKFYTELENIEKEAFRSQYLDVKPFLDKEAKYEEIVDLIKKLLNLYGKNVDAGKKINAVIIKERKNAAKTYISDYEEFCSMFERARNKVFNIEKDLIRTEKLLNYGSVKKYLQATKEKKTKENLKSLRGVFDNFLLLSEGWKKEKTFPIPESLSEALSEENYSIPKEEITYSNNVSEIFDGKGGWYYNKKALELSNKAGRIMIKVNDGETPTKEEMQILNELQKNFNKCILLNLNGKDSEGKEYKDY